MLMVLVKEISIKIIIKYCIGTPHLTTEFRSVLLPFFPLPSAAAVLPTLLNLH